jgi:hypothetical protein
MKPYALQRQAMTYRLPVELLDRIRDYSKDHGISGTASVTFLLTQALRREGYAIEYTPSPRPEPEQG